MNQEKYYRIIERDIERIKKYAEEMRRLQSTKQLKQKTEGYTGLIPETFLG